MKKIVLVMAFLVSLSASSVFAQAVTSGGMSPVVKVAALQTKAASSASSSGPKACVLSTIGDTLNSLEQQGLVGITITIKNGTNAITEAQNLQAKTCGHVPGITVGAQEGIAVVTISSARKTTQFNAWNKDGYILFAKLSSNYTIE